MTTHDARRVVGANRPHASRMRVESLGALERHLVASAARPQTVSTYLRIGRLFLAHGPASEPDRARVEAFLARPRRTGAPAATATRNLELLALRALFVSNGGANPAAAFSLKRPDRRDPDVPTTSELAVLFEQAARRPDHDRALAILALLFGTGLRVHELVGLDVEQLDHDTRSLVGVFGKAGSRFEVPLSPEVASLLQAWVAHLPAGSVPLFPSARPGGRASVRSIQRLLARLRQDAGLAKRITPHSLRHAAATQAIARGVSLPDTAALLRHARVETTMGYVHLASDARRNAATRIAAAIPRSVLRRKDSENRGGDGARDAVDAEHDFSDLPSARCRTGRASGCAMLPSARHGDAPVGPSGRS